MRARGGWSSGCEGRVGRVTISFLIHRPGAERWPSGRRHQIANLAYWVTGTEGSNPSLSAIESLCFCLGPEMIEIRARCGLIRLAPGSGGSDQSCKSPIRSDSSLFRSDSVHERVNTFRQTYAQSSLWTPEMLR